MKHIIYSSIPSPLPSDAIVFRGKCARLVDVEPPEPTQFVSSWDFSQPYVTVEKGYMAMQIHAFSGWPLYDEAGWAAGSTPISVPPTGSPFVWINESLQPKRMTVVGVLTLIEINIILLGLGFQITALIGGTIVVQPGDSVRLTYLVAPTLSVQAI